jgi:hypothetical protein
MGAVDARPVSVDFTTGVCRLKVESMFLPRKALAALLLTGCSASFAVGCSCSNTTPIQKTYEHYRERAVFTAHVVQLMGKVYKWDGKRLSSQVLAVVKHRYWGFPWHWPEVVMLDGSYPCDIAMEEGQDYLVSGRRERYGVLNVAVCSRTQLLKSAQIDLRTLDGSHCAEPGGTVIGHLREGRNEFRGLPLVPNVPLTFRDQDGKTYQTRSDKDGIYELQHLAAGTYSLDSHLNQNEYLAGGFTIESSVCREADVGIGSYDISGQFLPGLGYYVTIKLVAVDSPDVWVHGRLQFDGKFYFKEVPDGEYLLAVGSSLQGERNDFYYPGTYDRHKAAKIRVVGHKVVGPNVFNFKPEQLPYVPIPVTLDIPKGAPRFTWNVLLSNTSNMVYYGEKWTPGEKSLLLYGLRGQSYNIQLRGYPDYRTSHEECYPDNVPITATPGRKMLHIAVPTACR